ncbi:MAG: nitroreductase family protein [Anaerolineae bacterium]|jgi:nitroreductase|nr:nitroreductase [Chloroflexota bacterium]
MDVFAAMANRHSYRGPFTAQPVSREHLRQIVVAALQSPSANNTQTTAWLIVDEPALLEGLRAVAPDSVTLRSAPAVLVTLVDKAASGGLVAVNYGAAVENALLAATGLGYATLWMEGWKNAPGSVQAVEKLLQVPEDLVPTVLIPLGVPAEPVTAREKRPFEERAWWNLCR